MLASKILIAALLVLFTASAANAALGNSEQREREPNVFSGGGGGFVPWGTSRVGGCCTHMGVWGQSVVNRYSNTSGGVSSKQGSGARSMGSFNDPRTR